MYTLLSEWLSYLPTTIFQQNPEVTFHNAKIIQSRLGLIKPSCFTIVITGTNGKGSVVGCLEALSKAANLNIGTLTSPHLVKINERIRVNNIPITDEDFCVALNQVHQAAKEIKLNYFQYINLAGLLFLTQQKLDLLVLEVGIGGRLDITNIIDNDLVVITNIDYDHCEVLGNTRELIAKEKVALIRPQGCVVVGDDLPPRVIYIAINTQQAKGFFINKDYRVYDRLSSWNYEFKQCKLTALPKPHLLLRNVAIAFTAFNIVFPTKLTPLLAQEMLKNLSVPGRCQFLKKHCQWLLDVAHNPQGVQNLLEIIRVLQPKPTKIFAIFGVKENKDIKTMLNIMAAEINEWHLIELSGLPKGTNFLQLEQMFRQSSIDCYYKSANIKTAYQTILEKADVNDLVVVFGSFIVVGDIIPYLME
ncbi:MAG: hypothetical protein A3E87_03275 [Gammaproteobacteria bacterium RIFCSPHIGHO2_12_FULL_35_23]|nr:MAG: hypothetical protein A3E87_03275 [Gammaproteobacteria bacterium RIFCSPHIGHO2_12_FULL_35_23]